MHKFLENNLQDMTQLYGTRKIVFTGHSLGGALAALAALKFSRANSKELLSEIVDLNLQISLYTFGQPRIATWK